MKKLLILLLPCLVLGADHCCIPGVAGGDGSSWSSPFNGLPATLTRGDTYYLGKGAYGAYTCDDAASGTDSIYLVKATTAAHGPSTGWDDTLHGPATFTGPINVNTGYWVIDGKHGNRMAGSAYGIQVDVTTTGYKGIQIRYYSSYTGSHVRIGHADVEHMGMNLNDNNADCVYLFGLTADTVRGITMHDCWIHNSSRTLLYARNCKDVNIYRCYFEDRGNWDYAIHGQAFSVDNSGRGNWNIYNNVFHDIEGTGIITVGLDHTSAHSQFRVWNNLFFTAVNDSFTCSDGIFTSLSDNPLDSCVFYGNTIHAIQAPGASMFIFASDTVIGGGSGGNFARNNLLVGCDTGVYKYVAADYNGYYATKPTAAETHQVTVSANPFTDTTVFDYTLNGAVSGGLTLASPYDLDFIGATRGADGGWDIGAYEYDTPTPICTLTIAAGTGGTVSPSGAQSDTCGDALAIEATPATGYVFHNWARSTTKATITDSTDATTTVERNDSAAGTVTVTANFLRRGTWLGTTNASAKNAANWAGAVLPTNNVDTAIFTAANNNACDFDSSFSLSTIRAASGYTATITVKTGITVQTQKWKIEDATYTVEGSATFNILPQTTGDAWTIGSGASINGAGAVNFSINGNSLLTTLPTATFSNSAGLTTNARPTRNNTCIVYSGDITLAGNLTNILNTSGLTQTIKRGAGTFTVGIKWEDNVSAGATLIDSLQSAIFNVSGNVTLTVNGTLNLVPGTSLLNLIGTATQTVTSAGKSFAYLTVNNSGTVIFADSTNVLYDFSVLDGRDSIGRLYVGGNYTNTSNDSVFHTDTTIILGSMLRNNDKTRRTGGAMSFRGTGNGTLTLQDAGTLGPLTIRKSVGSATMTAATNIRANRILDSVGSLKMGTYSLTCTTLTNYSPGLQCAAVTLDTLKSHASGIIGGGTIGAWNWNANGIAGILAAGTTTTVTSVSGLGGTSASPDTMRSGTPGSPATLDFAGDQTITVDSAMVVINMTLAAGDTVNLPKGVDGGGNTGAWIFPSSGGNGRPGRGWRGLDVWGGP